MSALDEWLAAEPEGHDVDARPVRGAITEEASADWYARKGRAAGEDPPDGCGWCGTGPFTGHRGCTNAPMTAEEEARWWADMAWRQAEPAA